MGASEQKTRLSDLREEIIRLAPWHFDIEITPELSTRAFLDAPRERYPPELRNVQFHDENYINPRANFARVLEWIYPDGLAGRSVLDCGCNSGAFLFWAKELGAGRCFGFDARERWIEQARFVAAHRTGPGGDVEFEVCDVYDVPKLGLEPFDIVIFNGLLYHLPEPVAALKLAGSLTKELLILQTTTDVLYPDGCLVPRPPPKSHAMAGVHGLRFFPSGPAAVSPILRFAGLPEIRCHWWYRRARGRPYGLARLEMLASPKERFFERFDGVRPDGLSRALDEAEVPAGAKVLVASGGDEELLKLGPRCGLHFPMSDEGSWSGSDPADGAEAIAHVEELRAEGAEYLVFPESAAGWLDRYPDLREHLHGRYSASGGDGSPLVVKLAGRPESARRAERPNRPPRP